jgi:FkbM family methyltransferase
MVWIHNMTKIIVVRKLIAALRILRGRFFKIFTLVTLIFIKALPDDALLNIQPNLHMVRRLDYKSKKILLSIQSPIEYYSRLNSCRNEPDTIKWIETFFKKGDVFFDIGANTGAYSLVASKLYNGEIVVYSFEPSFPNYPRLCENVFLNDVQESVIPLPVALSDNTTIDAFNYQNIIPGGSLHALGKPIDYLGENFVPVLRQPVLSYRIDDLLPQFNIPTPNHIKIDVDGIELAILEGAKETLSNPLLRSIMLELVLESKGGNDKKNRIFELLTKQGFKFHSNYQSNYLFDRATS